MAQDLISATPFHHKASKEQFGPRPFFILLAQNHIWYLVLSPRKTGPTWLHCLSAFHFPFLHLFLKLLSYFRLDTERETSLSQPFLLKCSAGQGRVTESTSPWWKDSVVIFLQTPEHDKTEMQEKKFHCFCSSQNLVFNLVTKHVFSFVMNIQTINWKTNWIDFILPVSDSLRLGGGERGFHNQLSMSSWCAVDAEKTNAVFAKHMHMETQSRSREVTLLHLAPVHCY